MRAFVDSFFEVSMGNAISICEMLVGVHDPVLGKGFLSGVRVEPARALGFNGEDISMFFTLSLGVTLPGVPCLVAWNGCFLEEDAGVP